MKHEQPVCADAEILTDGAKHILPAKHKRPFARKGVVSFRLQFQRGPGGEAPSLGLDHGSQGGLDLNAERPEIAWFIGEDAARGKLVAEKPLQAEEVGIASAVWDVATKREEVRAVGCGLPEPLQDLLVRRRRFVIDEGPAGEPRGTGGITQYSVQILLDRPPVILITEAPRAWLQRVLGRNSVVVALVPARDQGSTLRIVDPVEHSLELAASMCGASGRHP